MFRDGLRLNGIDRRVSGTWSNGDLLSVSGSSIVATAPGGGGANAGTVTLDFGATPAETASVTVTGQTWVASGSQIKAFFMRSTTAGNSADEHEEGGAMCPLVVGDLVAGTGFTIYANPINSYGLGQFTVGFIGS